MAPDILWQRMLIYIQEAIWIEDQGERAHPYALHYTSHISELPLAFHYDWENETILPDALRHFKRYQTCIVTFCTYYIAWVLGDEGRGENGDCSRSLVRTVSTGCETPQCAASWMLLLYARDSSRWLLTPGPHFLSRGAQTFWHRARAYSGLDKYSYQCQEKFLMTVNVACGVSNKKKYFLYLEYMLLIYTSKYIPKKCFVIHAIKQVKMYYFMNMFMKKYTFFYP